MHLIIQLMFVIAACCWGDWRHWERYYSTILFLVIGDLLNNFINYNHPLWTYVPHGFEKSIYPNHTVITLGQLLLAFPALVLLYLGNYPDGKRKQFVYVARWVALLSTMEAMTHYIAGGLSYSNGWKFGFSVIFDMFLFVILRIHYLHPLAAWALAVVAIFTRVLFVLPTDTMK